jgi:hypothetical protein
MMMIGRSASGFASSSDTNARIRLFVNSSWPCQPSVWLMPAASGDSM